MGYLTSGTDQPMGVDQGPVVQSAILRGELVRLRKENGFTQEDVARDLEWSTSKVIRIEGGHSRITKVDLDALLTQYGVTSRSERAQLLELNRKARSSQWWSAAIWRGVCCLSSRTSISAPASIKI